VRVRVRVMVGVELGLGEGRVRVKLRLRLGLKLIGHLHKHVHINYWTSYFIALSRRPVRRNIVPAGPHRTLAYSVFGPIWSGVRCGISTYSPCGFGGIS